MKKVLLFFTTMHAITLYPSSHDITGEQDAYFEHIQPSCTLSANDTAYQNIFFNDQFFNDPANQAIFTHFFDDKEDMAPEPEFPLSLMYDAMPPFKQNDPDFSQLSQAQLAEILFPNKDFWLLNSQLTTSHNAPLPPEKKTLPRPPKALIKKTKLSINHKERFASHNYNIRFHCSAPLCHQSYREISYLTHHLTEQHHYNLIAYDAHYFCAKCAKKIYGRVTINQHLKNIHSHELEKQPVDLSFVATPYLLKEKEPSKAPTNQEDPPFNSFPQYEEG